MAGSEEEDQIAAGNRREDRLECIDARASKERFYLSPEEEDELLVSLAEIERGEFLTLDELLATLPKRP